MSALEVARYFGILIPSELGSAVEKRRLEFVAGRVAARRALEQSGFTEQFELKIGADRSPAWPQGWVGSLTHFARVDGGIFVSAAVARQIDLRSIGLDSERVGDLNVFENIREATLCPGELENLTGSDLDLPLRVGLLFSAKESFYKALAPRAGRMFDFQQVRAVAMESGTVTLRLETTLSEEFPRGFRALARYEINDHIHTAVELGFTG